MCLDEEKEYVSTIWNSSVLVSDYSGMIPEYFVTGKPLVFCASNFTFQPAEHFARMLEGCYVVYNEEELHACLEQLKQGNDTLREKREAIIEELFGDTLTNSTNLIIEELARG
jgi:CDP-glycerol glycerophosphotransferase (TagB/SpsB family)